MQQVDKFSFQTVTMGACFRKTIQHGSHGVEVGCDMFVVVRWLEFILGMCDVCV